MSDANPTLSVLLGLRADQPAEVEAHLAAVEQSKCLKVLQERMRDGLPPGFWRAAAAQVLATLRETLDVPLGDVLAGAWNKYDEFLKYTDRKRYPPEVRSVVALAEHAVMSVHEPRVDVYVNDARVGTVDFEVRLRVTVEAAKLAVQDGRFMELRTGACKFKVTLACEDAQLVERTSDDFALPGVLSFGRGVPIVPTSPSVPA